MGDAGGGTGGRLGVAAALVPPRWRRPAPSRTSPRACSGTACPRSASTARRVTCPSATGWSATSRRQAAELAASAERAHLARELHDSVTQALFAMTLVTRSIELLQPRDPEAAAREVRAAALSCSARRWPRCARSSSSSGRAASSATGWRRRCGPTSRPSRAASGCPSCSRWRSADACRWRSRRPSTASPRRRCTTWSATRRPSRHGCESVTATAGLRLLVEDDGHGFDPRAGAGRPSWRRRHARTRRTSRGHALHPFPTGLGHPRRGRPAPCVMGL